MSRLAIIATHPIQYYALWFVHMASNPGIDLKVFYLWDFGVTEKMDEGFDKAVKWDIPLLEGYEHEFIPNTATRPGTSHFNGLKNPELRQRVLDWKPDAVLMMAYRYWSTLHFILKAPRDLPIFFRGDSHRLHQSQKSIRAIFRQAIIRSIFRRFTAALSVGTANRDYFLMHGIPEDRMYHCPHAVDNDRLISQRSAASEQAVQWRDSMGIPTDHRIVLYAGKFHEVKRPLDLIQGFRQANVERSTLLLVGSGRMEESMREAAADDSRIVFAPFQNQSMMPRTLAAADLVVLPSASETWGLILNEAMCMEKPIVASSHVGGALDLIEEGRNGHVYPMGDVSALASVLNDIMADDERLREAGRESGQIIKKFSYDEATKGVLSALEKHTGRVRN